MKANFLKYYLILLLGILIISCEKKYSWDFQSENSNRLVVDGILTNELKPQCIKLSLSNPSMNMTFRPYSGATVYVADGSNEYEFTESVGEAGSYYSEPIQAVANRTYGLTIIADSIYEASASAVSVGLLEAFDYILDTNNLYSYTMTDQGDPSMVEVYYNWSAVPAYCAEYGSCEAMETFYTLNFVEVNRIFAPDKAVIWFPAGTTIIRRKYSLSEEHQEFLRSLLMEIQWSGGIFDVQHGNVNTNISNGALGFFGVCMVVCDTTEMSEQ